MKKFKVVILSGAGISAESGLSTFRDNNGLWEQFKVEDVASINAFKKNTKVFLDFYNMRKNQMKTVEPNDAHFTVKEMENDFDVTVITQNVDNLHEKAGSSKIIHLHGELSKLKSSNNFNYKEDYIEDLKIGDMCPEGFQLRPHVVLFGEPLPQDEYMEAIYKIEEADIVIVVGTSLKVQPAASLPWQSKDTALVYYVDPAELDIHVPKLKRPFFYHIKQKASVGMEFVYNDIKQIYL